MSLPDRGDLADTLCFLRRHEHPDKPRCSASSNEADRIVRCLAARYAAARKGTA